tara:strand:- start:1189 stop:1464 length:276 start_codon:yes stop_codon:yes gene_type:complete
MGKLSAKDAEDLKKSGVLSKTALSEMEKSGHVSKTSNKTKKFFKTADGKFVTPMLYFRGSKNTTPSKKMETFVSDYEKLVDKYATTKTTNK